MKLNLGCSAHVVNNWVNVDFALGARLAKVPLFKLLNKQVKFFNMEWSDKIYIHDLTKSFPWKDNSVNVIYSSHTLEHFTKEQGFYFLSECYRVLEPTGILRIVVPDLKAIVTDYLNGKLPADEFIKNLDVLYINKGSWVKSALAPFTQFPHKCMYDNETLLKIFNRIGFKSSIMMPFESSIQDIKDVEIEKRTVFASIIEGIK
jgi:ubiquinone/menaquinone biosynthesis C-methylase UbiE